MQLKLQNHPDCDTSDESTVDVACKVPVANLVLAAGLMQLSEKTIFVKRDDTPSEQAEDTGSPAQVRHDQSGVPKNKTRI